ncbi:acetolactate synthase small subunit [Flavobacteriales bacterium]|jgi:acetolactate synthase-1/3 small subunit|nr:acetolactate synthase small subunit [Flavobacteriales bacterium]MDB2317797.1 acetolactate synthase small subunit [Flavobacteriales bacterium]
MKKRFTLSIFTENIVGILNQVTIIFTRRHINIESIVVSESEMDGIHRYTLVISETDEVVRKVVLQLEKQVDIIKALYHEDKDVIYQEIALFKMPSDVLIKGGEAEKIVRKHFARIISVEEGFIILEKTGHKEETQKLFNELKPYGVLEFVRSGRIAITKPMKTLETILKN